jgi:hypothetical protein
LLSVEPKVPAIPKFTVANAVDSQVALPFDNVSHLAGQGRKFLSGLVCALQCIGAGLGWARQPAGMGGSDCLFASLHAALPSSQPSSRGLFYHDDRSILARKSKTLAADDKPGAPRSTTYWVRWRGRRALHPLAGPAGPWL